jgi:hypothetical protein
MLQLGTALEIAGACEEVGSEVSACAPLLEYSNWNINAPRIFTLRMLTGVE